MPLRTARADMALIAELLTTAENEARALGDPEPAAEHVLLAALFVGDASAREALGAEPSAVRDAIAAVHNAALDTRGITGDAAPAPLPPSPGVYRSEVSAREVFQHARRLARRSPSGLRSAHVLLAVAEREHGTAARMLRHLGFERDAVVDAARTQSAS